jgi:hypothetical protein
VFTANVLSALQVLEPADKPPKQPRLVTPLRIKVEGRTQPYETYEDLDEIVARCAECRVVSGCSCSGQRSIGCSVGAIKVKACAQLHETYEDLDEFGPGGLSVVIMTPCVLSHLCVRWVGSVVLAARCTCPIWRHMGLGEHCKQRPIWFKVCPQRAYATCAVSLLSSSSCMGATSI